MAFYGFFNKPEHIAGGTLNTAVTAAFDSSYVGNSVEFANNIPGFLSWGTPLTDCWFHFAFYAEGSMSGNSSSDGEWMRFINAQGRALFAVDLSNGNIRLAASDSGTPTSYGSEVLAPANNTLHQIDIRLRVNSGGNNIIDFYVAGVLVLTRSIGWGSSTGVTGCILTNSDTNAVTHYSEIAVADEDTRDLRFAFMEPDGDGGVTDWDGDFNDVQVRGDGRVLSTDVVNERNTFTLSAYGGPASPTSVRGVFINSHAKAGATGPQNLDGVLRISATNYDASDNKPPVLGGPTVYEFANDPSTASAWNTTAFAALEAGLKSIT